MMPLYAIALIAVCILLWADFLRARERAVRIADSACRRRESQLLDETVELRGLGMGRDPRGRIRLRRRYAFELTRDGRTREPGWLVLFAGQLESLGFRADVEDSAREPSARG
ncbi:DUF3301 domain-containing protein [Thiohalorhabdus methylotrophus]|uniref:DUF3301 domain-containing protein n=1 Tax=Thiohalorhabdus methylotrophus TaxID=3242694 RepID=A0ABV4TZS2_9GAMM